MASSKPGRPAGSPNASYQQAVEVPAACPKCKSVNLSNVRGARVIRRPKLAGQLPSGFKYQGILWVRKVCECGQRVAVRIHLPAKE